jgi:hypothetical protein
MGMYTAPAIDEATMVTTVSSEWPRKELVAYGVKLTTTELFMLLTRVRIQILEN